MDVAGTIHRHPIAILVAEATQGGGPLMGTRRIQFGDKPIRAARGSDVAGPKVHRPGEDSGDMDVAGTIHRHPIATRGAGASPGGGPLMGTRRVEFGDKHIGDARGSDVAGPKVHRPGELSGGVHVAGTIHRHRLRTVGAGAAEGG